MSENKEMNMAELESRLEEFFVHKAPFQLPTEAKEAIVKYGPWVMLVLMILALPGILFLLGFSALGTAVSVTQGGGLFGMLGGIVGLASLILNAMALPGLFKRSMQGWKLAYYAQWVSVIGNLLTLNIVGAIVSGLIGFYILFQVKRLYK